MTAAGRSFREAEGQSASYTLRRRSNTIIPSRRNRIAGSRGESPRMALAWGGGPADHVAIRLRAGEVGKGAQRQFRHLAMQGT